MKMMYLLISAASFILRQTGTKSVLRIKVRPF